ncbi:MAG TPA: alpha/beta hydrolase [Candidatus Binatia bacterium]|nr:alpha/beta hydrolase [Candidatus Binatia bacterium]
MSRRSAFLASALVVPIVLAMSFADRLVYFPVGPHDATPTALGLAYEDVHLQASDGVAIHAWFVPAEESAATPRAVAQRPAVLFLHGNAGNISHRLDKLAVLHSLGASVLLLDYRGYGASEGTPSEEGLYRDADAAYDWLIARGVAPAEIVPYGESLGGAVATDLAARRPVGGLVLESAPTSIIEVARHHYPYVPVALLLSDRYDAASRVARVTAPILILHSPDDEIVPFAMAEELLAAARGPKRLVRLAGGHNDGFLVAATAYREALRTFLARRVHGAP